MLTFIHKHLKYTACLLYLNILKDFKCQTCINILNKMSYFVIKLYFIIHGILIRTVILLYEKVIEILTYCEISLI